MKIFPLQTFFFVKNLCTSANIFFEMQTIFFTHFVFASNLFYLFRPSKQFFSIFFIPPLQKNNGPSLNRDSSLHEVFSNNSFIPFGN